MSCSFKWGRDIQPCHTMSFWHTSRCLPYSWSCAPWEQPLYTWEFGCLLCPHHVRATSVRALLFLLTGQRAPSLPQHPFFPHFFLIISAKGPSLWASVPKLICSRLIFIKSEKLTKWLHLGDHLARLNAINSMNRTLSEKCLEKSSGQDQVAFSSLTLNIISVGVPLAYHKISHKTRIFLNYCSWLSFSEHDWLNAYWTPTTHLLPWVSIKIFALPSLAWESKWWYSWLGLVKWSSNIS